MGCACCSHASSENDTLRVAIFGLENSGKTSLVQSLKTSKKLSKRSTSVSTHGVLAVNVHITTPTDFHLLLFDCGGCKHQRHIWPHLLNNSDLIVFTVDSMDVTCLHDARDALFDLLDDEGLIDKPLLVVFTKADQQATLTISQMEQSLDLSLIQVSHGPRTKLRRHVRCSTHSIQDRSIHKVSFSSMTFHGWTSMLAWFSYFSHCKLNGKAMSVSSKIPQLSPSLDLFTKGASPSRTIHHHSPNGKSHGSRSPSERQTRTSRSSLTKDKKKAFRKHE